MPILIEQPDDRVRKIRIQVDDEWVAHDFGRLVERDYARHRVLSIVDALLPPSSAIE